jgi:endonuclease YncB( thermonuclease family)
MLRIWSSFGLALMLAACIGAAAPEGRARVLDGDTLIVAGDTVRLFGIDAPEHDQTCKDDTGTDWPCGRVAQATLRQIIGANPVTCTQKDRDHYGRVVATCKAAGRDLAAQMVKAGMALAYRRYSRAYLGHEARAKAQGRGLHAGAYTAPEVVRKAARHADQAGCLIKGNIARSGARIYHRPGQAHYDRTRISPSRGERWFCSAAEARKAGWRASKSPGI